jgi:D-lactate dehydrogenase (cytochrome)
LQHRIKARAPRDAGAPRILDDPGIVSSFLSDAAHVPGGFAAGVAFPTNEAEVAALVSRATRILPIGAQSSLTGGATPRGEIILCTRALSSIGAPSGGRVRVGAGMPLSELQKTLANSFLYYPPVPTFDGASVGGTLATNASGPATFKYGSTRRWVEAMTIVLANGDVLDIERGQTVASPSLQFEIERPSGELLVVPLPAYQMPDVQKLSAGYFTQGAGTDLIDLFVGSEGTLGVIIEAAVGVVPRPRRCVVLVACRDDAQAIDLTRALRAEARAAWAGSGPLDVAAIEYLDAWSLDAVSDEAFARAGIPRPDHGSVLLLVQLELGQRDDESLARLEAALGACGLEADPRIAMPDDDRGARQLLELREAVPTAVNARVALAKAVHPDIEKTAGDMIVPFDRVAESLDVYRDAFDRRELRHATWGHLSDGNLHPNLLPRSLDDVERGREAILEIARRVTQMGGAPLAEHGVGRSALKQQLLLELYGENGINQMRAVKRALDPEWKLSPGVLFPS